MSIGGAISDVLGTRNLVFDQLKVLFNFGNIIKHGKKTKDGIKVFGYPKIRIGYLICHYKMVYILINLLHFKCKRKLHSKEFELMLEALI